MFTPWGQVSPSSKLKALHKILLQPSFKGFSKYSRRLSFSLIDYWLVGWDSPNNQMPWVKPLAQKKQLSTGCHLLCNHAHRIQSFILTYESQSSGSLFVFRSFQSKLNPWLMREIAKSIWNQYHPPLLQSKYSFHGWPKMSDARKIKGVKQPTKGCDICEKHIT